MDDIMFQSIISCVIGIVFIVAAILYIRKKNKGTTRNSRIMDMYDRYDEDMEQFRTNKKK